ncbi:MAG: adenylyltransferase/cytidyltransferase family protein [Bacteroidia bacterium]|nr:adenylyltransferase/cytidyltransferase family protein [Bacteroidia bacterium]
MKIYYDFQHLEDIRNAVVTTGSFDGVHSGHKAILERLKKLAFEIGGETVLITFHPHPRKVLYPATYGKDLRLITSPREKIELLSRAGLDHLIIVNFTKEFSEISSLSFVRDMLLKKLHARKIITGYNHHFGHNREGDTEMMRQHGKQYGFDVEEIPEQEIQQESVSSVFIRKALLEGNIQRANRYLDHNYIITGKCTCLNPLATDLTYPLYSIKLEDETKLLPPDGTYPVIIIDDDDKYPGHCFIRNNPESPLLASITFETGEPVSCLTEITTLLFQDNATDDHAH